MTTYLPGGWHLWLNSFTVTGENLHTVDISSTPYLPLLVNVVCESPLNANSIASPKLQFWPHCDLVLTAHSAARSLHEAIMRSEYRLSRPWTTTEGFGAFFRGSLSDMLKAGLAGHTVHFHEFHLRHKLYFWESTYWSYMVHKDCKINSIHQEKATGFLKDPDLIKEASFYCKIPL